MAGWISMAQASHRCTQMEFLLSGKPQHIYVSVLRSVAPLKEGMATHSSILAWRIPWTEEPGGLCTAHRVTKSQTHTQLKRLSTHAYPYLSLSIYLYLYQSKLWFSQLDHKEGWVPNNWCCWIVVLEKTLEHSLDCKEVKPVNSKGNQPRIFIGRTVAKAKAPVLWSPDAKSWLFGKDPDAGKDWQQKKGATEDETVRSHHWLNGHEFEQTPGDNGGQRSRSCYSPWGCKELESI